MARIRSVHPGLFSDEAFVSCSVNARLLSIGLWTEADDKGVFEWKPLQLKMRLFPADNVDVPSLLLELESVNIVKRYEVDGKPFGAIRNFRKYQRPKKPNDLHPLPVDLIKYVGLSCTSSEPVGNQFRTGGEISPQMEDGGWRVEDGGDNSQHTYPRGRTSKGSSAREHVDADGVIQVEDWPVSEAAA
ncbi:hypothetical protein [Sinorhizobium fredii]|uniref:hypothetical protein n=1 Tax=Rhizobium fredii TaxID=380 RepID=UPI0006807A02|nr:hypothetical protein [Sinorhizobium fredii]